MGFLLFIIAMLLWIPLQVINLIIVMIKEVRSRGFFKVLDQYFLHTAEDIDRFANRNFRTLWNISLKTQLGYKFGNVNETISSALGKNQRDETLSFFGLVLCRILDALDKNHCKKSINEEYCKIQ